jgi:hypothetical protein
VSATVSALTLVMIPVLVLAAPSVMKIPPRSGDSRDHQIVPGDAISR